MGYNRKNQFWAALAAGQYCEKKLGADFEQLLRPGFLWFHGQKLFLNFWEYCSVRTKTLHRINVKESQKKIGEVFFGGKNSFFRAKNLNVSLKDPLINPLLAPTVQYGYWLSYIDTKCNHSPLNHNV